MHKYAITRSSKPTQAQGLCGLTHCYSDIANKAKRMKNKKNNFNHLFIIIEFIGFCKEYGI